MQRVPVTRCNCNALLTALVVGLRQIFTIREEFSFANFCLSVTFDDYAKHKSDIYVTAWFAFL